MAVSGQERGLSGPGEVGVGGSGDVNRLKTALQACWIFCGHDLGFVAPNRGFSPQAFGGRPCRPAEAFWGAVFKELCGVCEGRSKLEQLTQHGGVRLSCGSVAFCGVLDGQECPSYFLTDGQECPSYVVV
jgi:hypothetical protein